MSETVHEPVIIALCGKGGVGKTSLSAMLIRHLRDAYPDKRILAIDADPAVGLATALGIDVATTVDDIRMDFIAAVERGESESAIEMLGDAKVHIMDALVEEKGLSFLAIGRPESSGCYCKVNAYLKEIISVLAKHFDYVVIDGEAGIEQVNRRVMEKVNHLVLVSDASRKGINVIRTIREVADNLVMYEKCGVIINRMPDMSLADHLDLGDMKLLACIPDDREMTLCDMMGKNVFEIPEDSEIFRGSLHALQNLEILKTGE